MQIGGTLGSIVGRYLRVEDRERRILLIAGLAAGISAVFRTPLGAALLAVEILHRDDFESAGGRTSSPLCAKTAGCSVWSRSKS
jgi:chloride channel protein, CIC family